MLTLCDYTIQLYILYTGVVIDVGCPVVALAQEDKVRETMFSFIIDRFLLTISNSRWKCNIAAFVGGDDGAKDPLLYGQVYPPFLLSFLFFPLLE
jgi:hypothetical protein